jgi:hypothetical protein
MVFSAIPGSASLSKICASTCPAVWSSVSTGKMIWASEGVEITTVPPFSPVLLARSVPQAAMRTQRRRRAVWRMVVSR